MPELIRRPHFNTIRQVRQISTFLLRFLWNQGLVKHVSVLKPVDTLLDAFLLSLGLGVLKCC